MSRFSFPVLFVVMIAPISLESVYCFVCFVSLSTCVAWDIRWVDGYVMV